MFWHVLHSANATLSSAPDPEHKLSGPKQCITYLQTTCSGVLFCVCVSVRICLKQVRPAYSGLGSWEIKCCILCVLFSPYVHGVVQWKKVSQWWCMPHVSHNKSDSGSTTSLTCGACIIRLLYMTPICPFNSWTPTQLPIYMYHFTMLSDPERAKRYWLGLKKAVESLATPPEEVSARPPVLNKAACVGFGQTSLPI